MITDTELDHRATDAAAEIHTAVRHLTARRATPTRSHARRPVAIAVAATMLIAGALAAATLTDRHDAATVARTTQVELPFLLPRELPDGIRLHRVDSPTNGSISYAVYADSRDWQRGAILAQTITTERPTPLASNGGCHIRDTACSYAEYPVDNGATFAIVMWQTADLSVSVQSATAGRATLLAAATELAITDGRITNRTLAGYPLATSGTGPTNARTVADTTDGALTFTLTATPDDAPIDFLPGRTVDINGHAGWLSHQPANTTGRLAAAITWRPAPGVSASLASRTLTDEQLLRTARSVAPVSIATWDQLPDR